MATYRNYTNPFTGKSGSVQSVSPPGWTAAMGLSGASLADYERNLRAQGVSWNSSNPGPAAQVSPQQQAAMQSSSPQQAGTAPHNPFAIGRPHSNVGMIGYVGGMPVSGGSLGSTMLRPNTPEDSNAAMMGNGGRMPFYGGRTESDGLARNGGIGRQVLSGGVWRFTGTTPAEWAANPGTWYADPASAQWGPNQVRPMEGGQSGKRAGADDPSLRLPGNSGVRHSGLKGPVNPDGSPQGPEGYVGSEVNDDGSPRMQRDYGDPQPMRPSGVNVPGFEHIWRPGPNGTEGTYAPGTNTMNFQNGGFAPSGSGVTGGTFLHQNNNRTQGTPQMAQSPAMYSPEWNAAYMQGGAGHQTTPPVAARQIPNSVPNRPWFPTDLTTANVLSGNIPQGQTAASQNQSSVPQGQPVYGRLAPAYSGYNLEPYGGGNTYTPDGERGGNGEWVSPQQGAQMSPYADSFYDPNGMYGGNRPLRGPGTQPTGYVGYNMTAAPPPRPTYGNVTGGSGMWTSDGAGQGMMNSGGLGSYGGGAPPPWMPGSAGSAGMPVQGQAGQGGRSVGIGRQTGVTPTVFGQYQQQPPTDPVSSQTALTRSFLNGSSSGSTNVNVTRQPTQAYVNGQLYATGNNGSNTTSMSGYGYQAQPQQQAVQQQGSLRPAVPQQATPGYGVDSQGNATLTGGITGRTATYKGTAPSSAGYNTPGYYNGPPMGSLAYAQAEAARNPNSRAAAALGTMGKAYGAWSPATIQHLAAISRAGRY